MSVLAFKLVFTPPSQPRVCVCVCVCVCVHAGVHVLFIGTDCVHAKPLCVCARSGAMLIFVCFLCLYTIDFYNYGYLCIVCFSLSFSFSNRFEILKALRKFPIIIIFKTVAVCGHSPVILSLTINETLKWFSSLPILMQESLWW